MPLAERAFRSMSLINQTENAVPILVLRWPPDGDKWAVVVPCRISDSGIILAMPAGVMSEEEIDEGNNAPPEALMGPSLPGTASIQDSSEPSELVEVLLVEFNMQVRTLIEKKTARSTRVTTGFKQGALDVLPSFKDLNDLVEGWISSGVLRVEDYVTAQEEEAPPSTTDMREVLTYLRRLEERLDVLQAHPQLQTPVENLAGRSLGAVPKAALPTKPAGARENKDQIMKEINQEVGKGPGRVPDQPGGETAKEAITLLQESVGQEASVDDLLKVSMLKMLSDLSGKKKEKKPRKLPGLSHIGSSSEDEDSTSWSSTSRGGKGIEAVEQWKQAMKAHPDAYLERMEARMCRAVAASEMDPTIPSKYIQTVPVGKAKTAGYALFGFSEILRLMLENRPRQARLHTVRMMASMEQFLIDESWTVASRLTGADEPPWGVWAVQDLSALRRQYIYTRLAESTWVGALINELKEEEWLMKKRGGKSGEGKGAKGDKGQSSNAPKSE